MLLKPFPLLTQYAAPMMQEGASHTLLPVMPQGIAGAPVTNIFRIENNEAKTLRDVALPAPGGSSLLRLRDSAVLSLLPGDSISQIGSSALKTTTPPVTSLVRVGVGIYAFPILSTGFSPFVINFVPDATNIPGFPLYEAGAVLGWPQDSSGDWEVEELLQVTADGFPGFSRSGINTSIPGDIGSWAAPSDRWVVFGFDMAWSLLDRASYTDFSVSIAQAAHDQLQTYYKDNYIMGYRWYAHGNWNGIDNPPMFLGLGDTYESLTMSSESVSAKRPIIAYDFSRCFPVSDTSITTESFVGNISSMDYGARSSRFMCSTASDSGLLTITPTRRLL